MSATFSVLVIVAFAIAIAFAGCTSTPSVSTPGTSTPAATKPGTGQATPVVTSTPGPGTMAAGTPGPTQVLPLTYQLIFDVAGNGDTANPTITVTLAGGNGMAYDSQVQATLYRSDGVVENQLMNPPFSMGQSLVFPSTSSNYNRIVIKVTAPQVGTVTVKDEYVPFTNINPVNT